MSLCITYLNVTTGSESSDNVHIASVLKGILYKRFGPEEGWVTTKSERRSYFCSIFNVISKLSVVV